MNRNQQFMITVLCIVLTALCVWFDQLVWLEIPRIVLGSVTLLFIPGRRLTQAFFTEKELDLLERIALSFALSIAVVPLLVFYCNLAGIPISAWLVLGVVVLIVA
jgi:uncharacterized membrane protein